MDTFEGNNLVLVDEGHRGSGGEEWMDKRARLCANGFSFEYSATFGQAIKAAGTATASKRWQSRRRRVIPLHKLMPRVFCSITLTSFFYNDGYGKDFNILNLAEENMRMKSRPLYLTALLYTFYQQCRR